MLAVRADKQQQFQILFKFQQPEHRLSNTSFCPNRPNSAFDVEQCELRTPNWPNSSNIERAEQFVLDKLSEKEQAEHLTLKILKVSEQGEQVGVRTFVGPGHKKRCRCRKLISEFVLQNLF